MTVPVIAQFSEPLKSRFIWEGEMGLCGKYTRITRFRLGSEMINICKAMAGMER